MQNIHESIEYQDNLPVLMWLHRANLVQSHWHNSLELLFVLEGQVDIYFNGEKQTFRENDIAILPPTLVHSIMSEENNILLAVQISYDFISKHGGMACDFLSYADINERNRARLRNVIARMMVLYGKEGTGYELRLNSLALELTYLLARYRSASMLRAETQWDAARLRRMIEYIDENYQGDISLTGLAERENLSMSYVSKFFQKNMGVTFMKYLNAVRLRSAVKDLLETSKPITEVGLDNGFPNQKSFFKLFKDTYGESPKSFRNRCVSDFSTYQDGFDYFQIDEKRALDTLFRHLTPEGTNNTESQPVVSDGITVNIAEKGTPLKHTWKRIISVARGKDLLNENVRAMLRDLKERVGFEEIRFHNIFGDEMLVYHENADGAPIYNFTQIDQILDFLQGIGMKPFVELGFMPGLMAENRDQTLFYVPICVSKPKELLLWKELVHRFTLHCRERYGDLNDWHFEVWNEPDFSGVWWYGSFEEYMDLYKASWEAVKQAAPEAQVGGPACLALLKENQTLIQEFLTYSNHEGCPADFLSFHVYPSGVQSLPDFERLGSSAMDDLAKEFPLPKQTDTLQTSIEGIRSIVGEQIPLFVTEYNSDAWARNLCHDTCYEAAYVVKNTLETMDMTEGLIYWTLTDLMEEQPMGKSPFFGNFGLYNIHGIPKPHVLAFELLTQLGNEKIDSGEGYFVTRNQHDFQVIMYNYCHFDNIFCSRDTSGISGGKRYNVFNDVEMVLDIRLENIPKGNYRKVIKRINRKYGSSFDRWVEMGEPEYLTSEEIRYLKAMANPHISGETIFVEDSLVLHDTLEPHEVCLIQFTMLD